MLFAHGARDPAWAGPVRELAARVAAHRPEALVAAAFLELLEPTLPGAVAQLAARGARRVVVFPLFMAPGGHLRRDVPALMASIRAAHPGLDLALAPPLGAVPEVLEAIARWVSGYER